MYFHQLATVVFCCILVLSGSVPVFSQSNKIVEGIDIVGNRRISDKDVLPHIKTRPGQLFSQEQTQDDLKSLLSLGVYYPTNTRVIVEEGSRGGVYVIFEVREYPLINSLEFEGLPKAAEQEVRELLKIKQIGIEKGGVADPVKLRRSMRTVEEFLTDKGWSDIKVEFVQTEVSATEMAIKFIIAGKSPVMYL